MSIQHTIKAHSPLGADTLRFRSMQGTEALSQLFELNVELVADRASLDLKSLLGQSLTLEIETADGGKRYLDGIVARAALAAREGRVGAGAAREWRYRAVVRPWLWLLTQSRDCKIFQNQSVPEILQSVLADYGFPVQARLTGSYRPWTYCVQYQESDFDFISRLMEHEGIYYYFEHAMGSHTLVLVDDIGAHAPLPQASFPYFKAGRIASHVNSEDKESVDVFQVAEEIAPGAYVLDDYNFTKPRAVLRNQRVNAGGHTHGDLEIYDWMAGYGEPGESDHYSRVRLEQLQAERERDHGHAHSRWMAPGYTFSLSGSPRDDANREYLLVSVSYRFQDAGYASDAGLPEPARYECDFVTQPTSLPYRAARITPQARARGPQTAVVVGPPGEVIWTDQYGRVKVQFRWDRYGSNDENSSCWLRVASSSAGSGMGAINLPRIGQEVLVDFIGGQLDRPIILGCTYNADMMPAHGLPASATRSLFVSRSLRGGEGQASSLVFDDLPGAEQLALHAEKDYRKSVEHDKRTSVGNDHDEAIGRHAEQDVSGNKRTSIASDYDHHVGASSIRTVSSSSSELHGSDYHHTSIGPSILLRQAPHVQTYDASYVHHVTGPATSTWLAPHTLSHIATYDHTVAADHVHKVGGAHRQTITSHHVHSVGGDHEVAVHGGHTQVVAGEHVHTVAGNYTLTTGADSHHATPNLYSLNANTIHIGGGGGGGGTIPDVDIKLDLAGSATGKIDFKAARFTATVGTHMDWAAFKISSTALNVSFDAYKFSIVPLNATILHVDVKALGLKMELGKKKEDPTMVKLKCKMLSMEAAKHAFYTPKAQVEA